MRTGALGRLELITRIPGHDSIAAAARALYEGRVGALQQIIRKIEALQVLQAGREQTTAQPQREGT
jgi:hypothetical protein